MKKFSFTYLLLLFVSSLAIASNSSGPVGWASVNANGQNGTTGGAGGTVVTVTNMNDLITYCSLSEPYIIQVQGMIPITPKGRHIAVTSNKTIIGIAPGSGLYQGGFSIGNNQKNIIIQNLTISDTYVEGDWDGKEQDWDGIQIKGTCSHIWINHCTLLRQGDGALDITNGANYITVSNSKFGENNKASLIGSSDTDSYIDSYKVTMHHNWFNETTQRNPRVRFGMVHLFNNYYYNTGGYGRAMGYANSNGYAIGIGVSAKIYSEHNYFEKIVYPSQFYDIVEKPGYLKDIGSYFIESGSMVVDESGIDWDPANFYNYTLDNAIDVKDIVMSNAGAEEAQTSVPISFAKNSPFNVTSYPNPFSISTNIVFDLPNSGFTRISLKDILGREIQIISNAKLPAGLNEISLEKNNLKPGVYIVHIELNGKREAHRIVIQ
jgi:pectate lyase